VLCRLLRLVACRRLLLVFHLARRLPHRLQLLPHPLLLQRCLLLVLPCPLLRQLGQLLLLLALRG
jgi:hypothetical protein